MRPPAAAPGGSGLWRTGELLAWLGGLVLTLSAFMGWYSISGDLRGNLAVLGWHTGTIGKLVFAIGVIVLLLLALRAFGVELPPSVPDGIVIAALGLAATILVLVRLIDVPEAFQPSVGGASASCDDGSSSSIDPLSPRRRDRARSPQLAAVVSSRKNPGSWQHPPPVAHSGRTFQRGTFPPTTPRSILMRFAGAFAASGRSATRCTSTSGSSTSPESASSPSLECWSS